MIKNYNFLHLAGWVITLQAVAFISGMASSGSIDTWYLSINRSPLTPPNIVFPIVWTILYVTIAVAGWLLWSAPQTANSEKLKIYFLAQLFFNWAWTPLFFYFHFIGLALIDTLLISFFNFLLVINLNKRHKYIALLLLPYVIWGLFASYLNYYIWYYN